MDFKIAIMDEQFENGQSEFGEIKLHRFEKKKDQKFKHYEIPLKKCSSNMGIWDAGQQHYCPEFSEDDVVYGNYYSEEYSFVRLAVHECDPMSLAALRK